MSRAILQDQLDARACHVSPFLVLGDPDPETSVALAVAAADEGATMLELGMPFSDPCADGPAIQAADDRARRAGVSTAAPSTRSRGSTRRRQPSPRTCWSTATWCTRAATTHSAATRSPPEPRVCWCQTSPSMKRRHCATRATARSSATSNWSGQPPRPIASRRSTTPAMRFLYLAAQQGITGTATTARGDRRALVERVAAAVARPLCLGFGLSTPDDLRDSFAAGARIAVVGSHLARVIERALEEHADVVERFRSACRPLLSAAPDS